jgi:type III pantothenate kinase
MTTTWADYWLALSIGNSRLHWALFVGERLQRQWETPHLSEGAIAQLVANGFDFAPYLATPPEISTLPPDTELWLSSVVPAQTALWQQYTPARVIDLEEIPLHNTYPSLGIDRALNLWGAGQHWQFPVLVIDAGTALTFTGGGGGGQFIGGAILPGVSLQLRSLSHYTASLPLITPFSAEVPDRWATSTSSAILSGVLYSVVAVVCDFVTAWWEEWPDSAIALTGGDSRLILNALQAQHPPLASRLQLVPHLVFLGMQAIRQATLRWSNHPPN